MKTIRYYITGHGLGHASRSCQIIAALRRLHPQLSVEVVSTAHPWFFRHHLDPAVPVTSRAFDFGVLQHDSLMMREAETLQACRELLERAEEIVCAEAADLRRRGVGLAVSDIPFLPFAAAARAGIPSVGISNFTWDWIYEGLAEKHPGYGDVVEGVREAYAWGDLLLRLPFAGESPAFGCTEDIPLVARRALAPPEEVRRCLGIEGETRLGLLSFGGFGLGEFDLRPLERLRDWVFVGDPQFAGAAGNLRPLAPGTVHYPDLVRAADAVITKPGYGIVSECVAGGTAVLYTHRGDFREQAVLIEALRRYTRAEPIDNERLRRGDWEEALERLLSRPAPSEILPCDGDFVAAERLAGLLAEAG